MLCFTISFSCSTRGALITTLSHPQHCSHFILLLLLLHFFWECFTTSFVHSYYCISSDFQFQCCTIAPHAKSKISFDFIFKCCTIVSHAIVEHIQWNAKSKISSIFRFQCYTIAPHTAVKHMQRNTRSLLAEIENSYFIVSDFRFQCCTFYPYAVVEHMQRNAKNKISFDFLFQCFNVVLHAVAEHMQRTRDLSLKKSEFLISEFLIVDFGVALQIPMQQQSTCNRMRKAEFLPISDFSVALLLPMRQQSTYSRTRGLSLQKSKISISQFSISILVLHCCSPCSSRAHAMEHMASLNGNQNFQFHSF